MLYLQIWVHGTTKEVVIIEFYNMQWFWRLSQPSIVLIGSNSSSSLEFIKLNFNHGYLIHSGKMGK